MDHQSPTLYSVVCTLIFIWLLKVLKTIQTTNSITYTVIPRFTVPRFTVYPDLLCMRLFPKISCISKYIQIVPRFRIYLAFYLSPERPSKSGYDCINYRAVARNFYWGGSTCERSEHVTLNSLRAPRCDAERKFMKIRWFRSKSSNRESPNYVKIKA